MKQYIITVDGGTTNTRCILWDENRKRVAEEKRPVGVRNTAIDGNNRKLKQAVKECLDALVEKNGLSYGHIRRIIASGMITSDVGIVVVPHLTAPAGLAELAAATVPIELPEICPIPIYFIPGIKNADGPFSFDNIEAMDIM
ncbi:MAG: 2-dehydro-3-deoxygalactonokinase, partial [Clostridium sp.]|nr:2-dehydro-3-deoxygalactonokinase [Clostridium sp.]